MKLSIIVVNWNTKDLLDNCLNSLPAMEVPDQEIIVVDNGSQDGSTEMVAEKYKQVTLIRNDRNEYFTKAMHDTDCRRLTSAAMFPTSVSKMTNSQGMSLRLHTTRWGPCTMLGSEILASCEAPP